MNHDLENAIHQLTEKISLNDLKKARDQLTFKYRHEDRHGKAKNFMTHNLERLSYLVTRFPATFAVVEEILEKVLSMLPELHIHSLLDLGSGPGTAFFAVLSHFQELKKADLLEQDGELIALGQKIYALQNRKIESLNWLHQSMTELKLSESYDLVTSSYALNELDLNKRHEVIEKAYAQTNKLLILIEPGTKEGFKIIQEARSYLIELGAKLVAPCPHEGLCPIKDPDWCHFSKRVSRTSEHRFLKTAELGYEDEKFSYIVVSKSKCEKNEARILRHPEKHTGHVKFTLCTKNEGIIQKTVSKKEKEIYKRAKKLEWGDSLF